MIPLPLTSRVARAFEPRVQRRGDAYARERRVVIESAGALAVARVRGSGGVSYRVHVTGLVDGRTPMLAASCECPHFTRGEWCKHVWATLHALEHRGWDPPNVPSGVHRLAMRRLGDGDDELDDVYEDDDDEATDSHDDEVVVAPSRSTPTHARRSHPTRPRPGGWRSRLEALRGDTLLASGPGASAAALFVSRSRLLYLLNVDDIRTSRSVRVHFARRMVRKDGSAGALMPAQLHLGELSAAPDPDERAALAQLITLAQVESVLRNGSYGYSSYAHDPARIRTSAVTVPMAMLDPVLPRLVSTGRLALVSTDVKIWGNAADGAPLPLAFDPGRPWQLRACLAPLADGGVALTGRFVREEDEISLDATSLVLAGGFLVVGTTLARAEVEGKMNLVAALGGEPIRIPEREIDAAVERLASVPDLPPLELAPEFAWRREVGVPRPRLRFDEIDDTHRTVEAELEFGYGAAWISPASSVVLVADRAARLLFDRDLAAEAHAFERLRALGCTATQRNGEVRLSFATGVFEALAHELLAKGWVLEVGGAALRSAGASRAKVVSGIDFFDLAGGVEYGTETVPYPELLVALRKGSRFVRLGDGTCGLMPRTWLERSARLAQFGEIEAGTLRFGRAQIGILAELIDAQDEARADRRFRELRRKIADFEGIAPADPPGGFQGTLRGYQREGLGWLHFLRDFGLGGCLADDMGLGKTVQVLALLASRVRQRGVPRTSLVVSPRSVVDGWIQEAARFVPGLRVLCYAGTRREDLREDIARHDLVVTTYGTMLRDVEYLAARHFDYVILDEAQAIKNAGSRTARAAKLLRSDHRLALTGTPVENHLGELASQLEFLNPGLFGRLRSFRSLTDGRQDAEALVQLARTLRPFLLRRTKTQVLAELPAKTEQTLFCDLEGKQRRDYDELRRHYQASLARRIERDGISRVKIHVLEALLRLRQAACHPALIDTARAAEPSAKLDLLFDRLDEVLAEGHKVLVFSQFTRFLARVRERLEARETPYAYLDGRTRDRKACIARFQDDPGCPVFLISLKAGGTGLNLTAADYVFLLDPWWNPAVEAQAIDRTHRIGQTRPVFAYRIVARDTVEERILELQERKRALAGSIFAGDESLVASLDAEDLRNLLA
jgi:superfamily II DNA or RNA helicase